MIEEIVSEIDAAGALLEEAWDLISQGKEKIQEAREKLARIGGANPPEALENAIEMADEGYGQAEQGQAMCTTAKETADAYKTQLLG